MRARRGSPSSKQCVNSPRPAKLLSSDGVARVFDARAAASCRDQVLIGRGLPSRSERRRAGTGIASSSGMPRRRAMENAFVRVWPLLVSLMAGSACSSGAASATPCSACVTDSDCAGGLCAQLGADSYCVVPCVMASDCSSDAACTAVVGVNGQQVSACVPRSDVCGSVPTATDDAGTSMSQCGTFVGPSVQASCSSCTGGASCQANGCYGGWWCNAATSRCQSPPSSCGSVSDGGSPPFDGGAPVTGHVGANGRHPVALVLRRRRRHAPRQPRRHAGYPPASSRRSSPTSKRSPAAPRSS